MADDPLVERANIRAKSGSLDLILKDEEDAYKIMYKFVSLIEHPIDSNLYNTKVIGTPTLMSFPENEEGYVNHHISANIVRHGAFRVEIMHHGKVLKMRSRSNFGDYEMHKVYQRFCSKYLHIKPGGL